MMTTQELSREFWMLTQGVLQDGRIDVEEACVLKRWLEEHKTGTEFDLTLRRLDKYLKDGMIDRFESEEIIQSLGTSLRTLRQMADAEKA